MDIKQLKADLPVDVQDTIFEIGYLLIKEHPELINELNEVSV